MQTPAQAPTVYAPPPRVVNAPTPITDTQPIAHRTRSTHINANIIALMASPLNTGQRAVSFSLPPTHVNKYSEAYRHLTPAQLQLARENTPWKQSPVAKNWMEISYSKVWAVTLPVPATLHNNRFALLADDNDNFDDDKQPTTATAYSVLDHDTRETLEHRQLQRLPKYKATWDTSYADEIG
jgi:hypothetical protein